MLEGLRSVGIRCEHESAGAFYIWADLGGLAKPLNDAEAFFRAGLERKVMTVPGRFFDINPGGANPPMKELKKWGPFFVRDTRGEDGRRARASRRDDPGRMSFDGVRASPDGYGAQA